MAFILLHFVILVVFIIIILLHRHRQPESRAAWLIVVLMLPYAGALVYLLLGQPSAIPRCPRCLKR